jgi:hypothetical protein
MTGSLEDRPVGLSRTQFEYAQKHGEEYWLYVVEHAASDNVVANTDENSVVREK